MGWFLALAITLNSVMTPGATRALSEREICATQWGKDRRHVTEAMKKEVARRYGVAWSDRVRYEFDHLIPRELGGADDVANLWPQEWAEARLKDRLENRLHVLVCRGELSLAEAQDEIRRDWRAAYQKRVNQQ